MYVLIDVIEFLLQYSFRDPIEFYLTELLFYVCVMTGVYVF
jgi:hypothetical protein